MSAVVVNEAEQFFAPSTTSWMDALLAEYKSERDSILRVSKFMHDGCVKKTMAYFLEAMLKRDNSYIRNDSSMFDSDMAISALDSRYWTRALNLTDVLDYMPSKKRSEWFNQIKELKTPTFDRDTVTATMVSLMDQRMDFLAEMVDGIFIGLSGEHVTNRPEGFTKRMIINYVYDCYMYSHGPKSGLIHDMRSVIAKFRGQEIPPYGSTGYMLDRIRHNTGVWHIVDGGAFRIRVYKNGNAHMEINPDISYRLNQILAYLHPMAIPAPHRRRPNKKKAKVFTMIQNPVPFSVLAEIQGKRWGKNNRTLEMGYAWRLSCDKHLRNAVDGIMHSTQVRNQHNSSPASLSKHIQTRTPANRSILFRVQNRLPALYVLISFCHYSLLFSF